MRRPSFLAALALPVLLAHLLVLDEAQAAPDVWESHGPPGGNVTALASEPVDPFVVFVGLDGGGLWKSSDGGNFFTTEVDPNPGSNVSAFAFDPFDQFRLFVGAGNRVFVTTDEGILFDGSNDLADAVTVIVPDPNVEGRVYAGTANGGLERSDDGGTTFALVESLLALDPLINGMAIDPTDSDKIYVSSGGGILWSDDALATFHFSDGSPFGVTSIIVDPDVPSRIYASSGDFNSAGVWISTDSGVSWNLSSAGLDATAVTALVMDPLDPSVLVAGTLEDGVFKSTDAGLTWAPADEGLYESRISKLAFPPDGDRLVLGGQVGGVFSSGDLGATWARGGSTLLRSTVDVTAVAGARILASSGGQALFASTDGGTTWTFSGDGLPARDVVALGVDPTDAQRVYAGTRFAGVFRSNDGGASWVAPDTGVGDAWVSALAVDPSHPDSVFLGTWGTQRSASIFVSHDAGATWALVPGQAGGHISSMQFAADGGSLFVATEGSGLFVTHDGGATFAPANGPDPDFDKFLFDFAIHPLTGALYHASQGGLGVSTDDAVSWTLHEEGLPEVWLTTVAPHPTKAGSVFVGTLEEGVAFTIDDGASFTDYSEGLAERHIESLAFDADGTTLVAGTRGGGAFIVHPGDLGAGGGGGEGGASSSSASSGSSGSGSGASTSSASTVAASSSTADGAGGGDAMPEGDDGCACNASGSGGGGAFGIPAVLFALASGLRARRRRARG